MPGKKENIKTVLPKAVFFDIDGTIMKHGKGPYADDMEVMEEAVNAGHLLFLNTGRAFSNIFPRLLNLPLWSGIAAGGGAHVLLKKQEKGNLPQYQTIYHKWIDEELLCEICGWYLSNQKLLILEGEKYCYSINPAGKRFGPLNVKPVKDKNDFKKLYTGDCITKLTMENIIEPERQFLKKHLKVLVFPTYAEAIIRGEDKGKAIKTVLRAINLKRKDSIAVGDSINDLDMIYYAGLGVAMGNACEELKAASDVITSACGEGGIAKLLRQYVLNGKTKAL